MQSENLYAVLGVTPDASDEQIRRAYRQRALQLHPDHNPGDQGSVERFRALSAAAATLTDPNRRTTYDHSLAAGHWVGGAPAEDGYDVHYTLHISAAEARAGVTKSLSFHGPDGGAYDVPIVVPPGARRGTLLYVAGAGGPSRDGRARGDLYTAVEITSGEAVADPGAGLAPVAGPACYRHPDRETGLSCTQCGRAICVRCSVPAAVGQVCPDCAQARRPVNYRLTLGALALAVPAAALLSLVICTAALLVVAPLPIFVVYLVLVAGAAAARPIVRVLDRLTRAKRGKAYQIVVGASLACGALPVVVAGALLFTPVDALLVLAFAGVLAFKTMLDLR